ncbi:hypothetical protein [Burkholderia ubonensis]|uniref:hypothetical protein n=1 Tax=Burkholderia ubonensis TaxID=101571 RepID=UPI0009B3504F|nr:hypothetical protein [Burkholderia ubonensis]
MKSCKDFYPALKENMAALGLPVPSSLFESQQMAIGTLTTLLSTFKSLGTGATMGELIAATTGLEKLLALSAIGASYYIGALIGSMIVATDASLACSNRAVSTISKIQQWAGRNGLSVPSEIYYLIARHPEIVNPGLSARTYAVRARVSGRAAA